MTAATVEQRQAGLVLLVRGALNALFATLLLAVGRGELGIGAAAGVALVGGIAFLALGVALRRGSRGAAVAGLVLLGLLLAGQLVSLATLAVDGRALFRLLVNLVLIAL